MSEMLSIINSAIGAFVGVLGVYRLFRQDIDKLTIQIAKIQTELEWIKKEFEEKKKHLDKVQDKILEHIGGKK